MRNARRAVGVGLLLPGLLVMPPSGHAAGPAKPAAKPQPAAKKPEEPCLHVVRSGDSVSRLASRYRVPRQRIIEANKLERPEALRVGQKLVIPGCDRTAVAASGGTATMAATPRPGPDGAVLVLVGPRRIPTRLYMSVPEFVDQGLEFSWPVMGPVLSAMGPRRRVWHAGIDIGADIGTPVYAAAPGSVYFSGTARGYGRVVKLEHENGFMSIYAHNLQNLVNVGERVEAGTVIATVGRSRASHHHLHFEIRRDGLVYNPLFLLPRRDVAIASADEMQPPPHDEDDEDE